jgi:hypothetical protein
MFHVGVWDVDVPKRQTHKAISGVYIIYKCTGSLGSRVDIYIYIYYSQIYRMAGEPFHAPLDNIG